MNVAVRQGLANEAENPDFRLSGYDFALPEELVAQSPASERSGSRLLILRRDGTEQAMFSDLLRFLPEDCLLVANNSRVAPARLSGTRPGGGKLECLLLTPPPLLEPKPEGVKFLARIARPGEAEPRRPRTDEPGVWLEAEAEGLLRPAKKIPLGKPLLLAPDLALLILERGPFGRCRMRVRWRGELKEVLERRGVLPLPPYVRRPGQKPAMADCERYQTIYARADKAGSVAAPTAGLHFTAGLREALERSGRQWEELTLHVGYGTFSPVRCPDIREHVMHAEYAELPERTLSAVLRAKEEGRPVIAVGTTSARVLEGLRQLRPELFTGEAARNGAKGMNSLRFAGWLSTFLYPGRPIQVIDGLVTNFHLPRSSLLMLVSALAGRERVLRVYREAIAGGFRFFSYGDAMLILNDPHLNRSGTCKAPVS